MVKIVEKIKNTWAAINYPDGVNKEYDKQCDDAFDKTFNKIINFCYFVFCVVALISIYLFVTRELL